MSMFKKKKAGNIRERIIPFDDEDDDGSVGEDFQLGPSKASNGSSNKKEKKKSKEDKRPAVNALSFEDELEPDDGIPFQEKKSVLSYKLRREMKKERKEKKKEEKGKTKDVKKGGIAELNELGIKIVNGREAEAIAHQPGDSDSDEDRKPHFKNSATSKGCSTHEFRSGGVGAKDGGRLTASSRHHTRPAEKTLDPLKNILQSGQIPDANTIHFIRKQRQKAREKGDFVPVEEGGEREPSGSQRKSRLVREEDTDRDEDDGGGGGGRVRFSDVHTGSGGSGDGLSLVEVKALAAIGRKTGSDEEDSVWESQQMKKAASKLSEMDLTTASALSKSSASFSFGSVLPPTSSMLSCSGGLSSGTSTITSSSAPTTQLAAIQLLSSRPGVNYQAEGIMKRLRDSRNSLSEVHRRHVLERATLTSEHEECQETTDTCERAREGLAQTFQLYQALRGYVTDLRECLNEKIVGLEELEARVLALYKQKTDKLLARRRQDVNDQNDEVSPFLNSSLGDESLKQCPSRARRAAEREGRRTRRRRERERRGGAGAGDHHDGTSTDDELTTQEQQEYTQKLEAVERESGELFSDVEEDFCSLDAVLRQLEKWRRASPQAYTDAYAANNVPKIVEVFVRMELLLWNPLADGVEVERQAWYTQLAMFAAPPPTAALSLEQLALDPDKHLLSHVVEKVVLVKLREVVGAYWDPLSHSQSVRLVNLVRHFCTSYPTIRPASKQLKSLCSTVIDKIKIAIDKDVFIPIFTKTAYESRTSSGSLFFQRQFWVAWKLLSQVLMWHKVLSERCLAEHGIKGILNPYLIPALNIASVVSLKDGLDKAKYVIQAMPGEWTKREGAVDGSAHLLLCNLEIFLANTATKTAVDSQGEDSLHEIRRHLKSISANRAADIIAAKYLSSSKEESP